MQGRLTFLLVALLLSVLPVYGQQTISAASNPVVVPIGQTTATTTITWKASPDYAYSEIYLSVDNAEWSEFARGGDGSKTSTFKLGSSYTFRMMVYQGQQGTPKVITALTVTTKPGSLAPPAVGDGISVDQVRDQGSDFRLAPIRNVRVDPGPRHIFIKFQGPPNQQPYVAIGRGAAIKQNGEWVFGDNLVGGGFVGLGTVTEAEKARGEYTFASAFGTSFSDDGLDPGRTYYYIISIPAVGGRSHQETGRFVMKQLSTTVKVVFERVLVLDDSDDLSTGEIALWFWANHGQPSAKFSDYYNGDADSGHGYDINRSIVIQNAPGTLSLSASGRDDDSNIVNHGFTDAGLPPLVAPGKTTAYDENVAKDTFDLTKYGDNETVHFALNTMPGGDLKFTIFGHLEITRTTATAGSSSGAENIGSISSPLQTAADAPSQFLGTFGTTPPNYQPLWVYAIKDDGDLVWYRKDSGASSWQGPKKVGNGWDFKDVIPAGGNSFYALTEDGKLFWYQHTGFNDGTRAWKERVEVSHGWSFASIFSGGEGVIYAITNEGKLLWYKHNGYLTGTGSSEPGSWESPREVGRGWNGFEQVFSSGGGIIYAITSDGKLRWYKHNGYLTGAGVDTPGAWDGPKEVGRGWNGFRQVVPAGGGVILVIQNDGKLRWYKHNGYLSGAGLDTPGAWDGPREVGSGWQGFKKVFALLPASSTLVR
jgi:hypothetical protein